MPACDSLYYPRLGLELVATCLCLKSCYCRRALPWLVYAVLGGGAGPHAWQARTPPWTPYWLSTLPVSQLHSFTCENPTVPAYLWTNSHSFPHWVVWAPLRKVSWLQSQRLLSPVHSIGFMSILIPANVLSWLTSFCLKCTHMYILGKSNQIVKRSFF